MALYEFFFLSLFVFGCLGTLGVFLGYPLSLYLASLLVSGRKAGTGQMNDDLPFVSMLVVFRNADILVSEKIHNFLKLGYPEDKLELVLISDGSHDHSWGIADASRSERIHFHHFDAHVGKTHCINFGISLCRGGIIVFSDVDAILESDAIQNLAAHFKDPVIGGVCGQRVVKEKASKIESGQLKYIQWDSAIKLLEVKIGLSVTAHDGKLYAIRKSLFTKVPPGVTDDAYISLSVTKQGSAFIFEPAALAFIKMPSRSSRHELSRRKRIVSTSLKGLWLNRKLFNPYDYGFFSIGLFVNKVVRRLIPFFLIGVLISSIALAITGSLFFSFVLSCQVMGYVFFLLYPWVVIRLEDEGKWSGRLKKLSAVGYFFCVGMAGTFLGVISFISGEEITKWDPVKK